VIISTIVLEQATAGTTFGSATPESVGFAAELPSALRTLGIRSVAEFALAGHLSNGPATSCSCQR
jgi:hypothetical protein